MFRSLSALALLALLPQVSFAADPAAAEACAAKLRPNARHIYGLAAPEMQPTTVLKDILTVKVRPLVMTGKLTITEAANGADSAADCLKLLK